MLKSIKQMFAALEANNIQYCHWKSNEHLLPALEGDTDLDILFLPEQRAQLDAVLANCGLKRFRATPLMQYNAIEDYIGFDVEKAKIWHLHVHYRMTLGEKHLKGYTVTPWGYHLIENRICDENGVYTSCYEDELILLFVRNALKLRWRDTGRDIGKDDRLEFTWLQERINLEKLERQATLYLDDVSAKYVLTLAKQKMVKKAQLVPLQRQLRRRLKSYTGYSRGSSWFVRTRRELYWGIGALKRHAGFNTNVPNRRVSPSGGCVVAFLGCDGAGKSTTLDYVRKEFSKKMDVKSVYLGSGDGSSSLLRKPMKLVAKKVGGKGLGHKVEKEYSQNEKVSLKARLYSLAKIIWAMTLAREKKRKLRQITKARNAGMLVLVDRYPQTQMPGFSDGPLLTRYLTKKQGLLYRWACKEQKIYQSAALNAPDLSFKLTVPTALAIARKPEMTVEEIENKKAAVMAMDISRKLVVIDTSVDKIVSFGKVMDEIWKIV